jgi:hypothetical protein
VRLPGRSGRRQPAAPLPYRATLAPLQGAPTGLALPRKEDHDHQKSRAQHRLRHPR